MQFSSSQSLFFNGFALYNLFFLSPKIILVCVFFKNWNLICIHSSQCMHFLWNFLTILLPLSLFPPFLISICKIQIKVRLKPFAVRITVEMFLFLIAYECIQSHMHTAPFAVYERFASEIGSVIEIHSNRKQIIEKEKKKDWKSA